MEGKTTEQLKTVLELTEGPQTILYISIDNFNSVYCMNLFFDKFCLDQNVVAEKTPLNVKFIDTGAEVKFVSLSSMNIINFMGRLNNISIMFDHSVEEMAKQNDNYYELWRKWLSMVDSINNRKSPRTVSINER